MAAPYSMDLRERVIQDAEAGLSTKELTARYHVSRAWVDALKQRKRETGSIEPLRQTKFRGRVLEGQDDRLAAAITAQPDATLRELREALKTPAAQDPTHLGSLLRRVCDLMRHARVHA
jgi:transposase